jgi:glycerol-3-phosphate dehydrogenase
MAVDPAGLPRVDGVPEAAYAALAGRYGYAARDVLLLAAERPELAAPIVPGQPDLLAEAAYAAQREQAQTVGDVLLRRTRLGLLDARGAGDAAERVATAMGGGDAEAYRAEAAAEGLVP